MRDSWNCSFIGGWSEWGVRSVRTGVYPGCKCGVWMCVFVRSPVPHLLTGTSVFCPPPPRVTRVRTTTSLSSHVFEVRAYTTLSISTIVEVEICWLSVVLWGLCVWLCVRGILWCVGVRSGVRCGVTCQRVWLWGVRVWLRGRLGCGCGVVGGRGR